MLVDGNWTRAWDPYQHSDEAGRFIRQRSSFRNWITPDGRAGPSGEGGFAAAAGRYHLYVALICPWASRTLMVRALEGLHETISVTVVEPDLSGELAQELYVSLNNGVYRAGFAREQAAHEQAVVEVFTMLDALELRLGDGRRFLFGDALTEADVRLFVTLVRFDAAYHCLFKCNLRRLADYPRLSGYLERVLALPGVRATVDTAHIKAGYYSIRALNPSGIVPLGPSLAWEAPRGAAHSPAGGSGSNEKG